MRQTTFGMRLDFYYALEKGAAKLKRLRDCRVNVTASCRKTARNQHLGVIGTLTINKPYN